MIGLSLYLVFIDPLLHSVHIPVEVFTDDVKFIANIVQHGQTFIES